MARRGREDGRPFQMPKAPVQTTSRKEEQDGPRRSLRIAEQPQKDYTPFKRKAAKEQQGPNEREKQAKVTKPRSSKGPQSQVKKKDTLKLTKTETQRKSREAKGLPSSSRTQQQRPLQVPARSRPATSKPPRRAARGSPPTPINQVTGRPPSGSHLSRAALRQLERETADDPLPEGIRQYKSTLTDENMPKSASRANDGEKEKDKAITVYSQTFLDELTERGILEQQLEKQGSGFQKPANYDEIRSAILKDRPHDKPSRANYNTYTESVMNISNESAQRKLYGSFFGTSEEIEAPHLEQSDERWLKHNPIVGKVDRKDCKQAPQPDLAEGLRALEIPRWIRKRLQGYAVPRSRLAFPNFLVELKRNKSMFTAHVQNRHCGAVAMQGFVEYYFQLHDDPKNAWNIARVGSIEFNGDIVVGNVHWASRSKKNPESRRYHMTRVMCNFTYGLSYEDFVTARKQARNFREYFMTKRVMVRRECRNLPRPPNEPPTSSSEEDEDSDKEIERDDGEDRDGKETEENIEQDGGSEGSENNKEADDTTYEGIAITHNGQQKAVGSLQPAARSRNKRSKRDDGRPSKKSKGNKKPNLTDEAEHTGLTQQTDDCVVVDN